MFHAFIIIIIIKLFAHIKPSLFIVTQHRATTWHFQTHLKLSGLQIFRAQSWSSSTNLPVRSIGLIFDFLDTCQADAVETSPLPPLPALAPPPPSSSSSRLSGNEVGLRDDALHFVIRRVRRRLVATDRHFVSVSLEITRREKGLQRRCATEVTIQLYY